MGNHGRWLVTDHFWRRNGCYEFDAVIRRINVQNSSLQKWREAVTVYAPLFLWIGVIFYFSSGQGSMAETSRFIRPLLEFLFCVPRPS